MRHSIRKAAPMASRTASPAITTTMTVTTMAMATITTTDGGALYRLLAWLSPAYPVGAYTYSHGLETAVEDGSVTTRAALVDYIATVLRAGAGRIDGAL